MIGGIRRIRLFGSGKMNSKAQLSWVTRDRSVQKPNLFFFFFSLYFLAKSSSSGFCFRFALASSMLSGHSVKKSLFALPFGLRKLGIL